MDRTAKLLAGLETSHKILEIGPSYGPLAPKSEGWSTHILDHATQEELRAKYAPFNVPVDKIEDVDFIWKDGPLDSAVPSEMKGSFDACIASHVIEHAPDLIEFLQACRRILKVGGILRLAVPDKRFCFDYFMPITTTADVLDAHFRHRQRHLKKTAFQTVAYNANFLGNVCWGQYKLGDGPTFERQHSLHLALAAYKEHPESDTEPYRDLHAWYFTPSSFELIVLEASALGLMPFEITTIYPAEGCEFIVLLRATDGRNIDPQYLDRRRLELLRGILFDIREQTDYLL